MSTLHTVTVDDRLVSFEFAGPSAAPRLLLLHGFPMDRRLWAPALAPLSEAFCVYSLDLPGFGDSARLADTQSMELLADWLARFIDVADVALPVRVCGLSMGGYIALEFAARHADKLSHLVLCDTKTEADSEEVRAARLALADSVASTGMEPLADSMLSKLLAPTNLASGSDGSSAVAPSPAETLRRMILDCDPASVAAASRGMALRRDTTDIVKQLPLPLLSVVGESDSLTPPELMQRFTDLAPQGHLVTIRQAGHLCPLEQPQAFAAALASV